MMEITHPLQRALKYADGEVRKLGRTDINSLFLLIGILLEGNNASARIFFENQVDEQCLRLAYNKRAVSEQLYEFKLPGLAALMTRDLVEALNSAAEFSDEKQLDSISTEFLVLTLLRQNENLRQLLLAHSLSRVQLEAIETALGIEIAKQVASTKSSANATANVDDSAVSRGLEPLDANNKSSASCDSKGCGSALQQFTVDLTALAKANKLSPMIGRNAEVARAIQILCRKSKNNPVLIGEAGVGKTAIVEGIAQLIEKVQVPSLLRGKRLLQLNLTAMLAGTCSRGAFEERLQNVIAEVKKAGNIILFLDELHTLVGAGATSGSMDAANALKPSLVRGEISIIGATTISEYRQSIENKDAALARRFRKVPVDQPSIDQTIEILRGLKAGYESHHGLEIADEALCAAAKLSDRYVSEGFLPDKAIDLLDETCSLTVIRAELLLVSSEPKVTKIVTAKLIEEVLSLTTGIPMSALDEDESARLLNLEVELHKQVVGQAQAVSALARAVRRGRAGMKSPDRPAGAYLFVGPTGVGKTHLAKALQRFISSTEKDLIRLDMTEYMERHSVARLIGAPPGYVGYGEGGKLTEAVRLKPYSVILLDEVEKAHPDVFNLLLQVLDDGRLTDGQGRTVDFKNTIVIMTSNQGARIIQEALKNRTEIPQDQLNAEIKVLFSPELINRLDEVICFRPLSLDDVAQVLDLLLAQMVKLLPKDVALELDEDAKLFLLVEGYDVQNGARPMRRALTRYLEDPISELILAKRLSPGDTIVVSELKQVLHFDIRSKAVSLQK
ncbi:ATP-dependent Clp protease ATP-binding subunit [bacterium]|nr:ATP-dependent Clp protease ATP-binding subunit [bacterium]MBP9810524.1 ATP-dependent Clp protease ATP-binding subunit [bacterium]